MITKTKPIKSSKSSISPQFILFVSTVAVIEPIMTIPQAWTIWMNKSAQDVSLLSWSVFLIAAAVWLVYGLKLKSWPLIITSSLWIVLDLIVVVGIILY